MKCQNCGHYEAITYKEYEIAHAQKWIWLTLAFCWLVFPIPLYIINLIIVSAKTDDGNFICKHCWWQGRP